jgi:hypothetical protein
MCIIGALNVSGSGLQGSIVPCLDRASGSITLGSRHQHQGPIIPGTKTRGTLYRGQPRASGYQGQGIRGPLWSGCEMCVLVPNDRELEYPGEA